MWALLYINKPTVLVDPHASLITHILTRPQTLQPFSNFKPAAVMGFPGRRLHITRHSSPTRSTLHLPPLHGQGYLASPTAAATARGREGGGDGAEEAPKEAARRPRLRLVPASPAAEEAGAEAGPSEEAAGGGGAAAAAEEDQAHAMGARELGRGALSCELLHGGVANSAAAGQADARLTPSPSLQLVNRVRALVLALCGHGWRFPLFGVEFGFAFPLLRVELVPVRSSRLDPLVTMCVCVCVLPEGIGRTALNFSNSVLAIPNWCLHLCFEVSNSVLVTLICACFCVSK